MAKATSNIFDQFIGKYVIVRSYNEGVNCGFLEAAESGVCVLRDARRMWYHTPQDKTQSWYEGVANTGLSEDSNMSAPVQQKVIVEDYSITVCSEIGQASLIMAPNHAQS